MASMNLQFVLSKRGKPLLIYAGFLHSKVRQYNGRFYWRCVQSRDKTCSGTCVTDGDFLVSNKEHSHLPDPTSIGVRQYQNNTKRLALTTQLSTQNVSTIKTVLAIILKTYQLIPHRRVLCYCIRVPTYYRCCEPPL